MSTGIFGSACMDELQPVRCPWSTHESTAFSLEGVAAAIEPEPPSDETGGDLVVDILGNEAEFATRATRNYAVQVVGHLLEEQRGGRGWRRRCAQ